jgi:UDP-3-O-[3-hydroxymyristoyl] N-acetylglucosamine deacetylase
VKEGDKWARFEPYEGYRLAFSIDFNHPVIDRSSQSVTLDFAQTSYLKEISRARTFGFMQDVENLRENGLALGGGLDNAVVLDEYRVLNAEGLRFADEFIRHKLLDAVGDLSLAGAPIIGRFRSYRGGHRMNVKLVEALFADPSAYAIVEPAIRRERGHADLGVAMPAYGPDAS